MTVKTFRGGAHPPELKEATRDLATANIAAAGKVVIHINQHFGAPNTPLVAVGTTVTRGQKIADSTAGGLAVPVHASVCGTVVAIENRPQSNLADGLAIVIEPDGRTDSAFMPPLDPFAATGEEARARIREAGIVGMGGAGFPAYVKLNPPAAKRISVVIGNGAECEPFLTTDYRTMLERPDAVIYGLAACMKITGCTRGVIAVEDNKRDAVPVLTGAIAAFLAGPGTGSGFAITVELVKTKYPQGGEKMLTAAILGREIPSGGLPMDVGAVIQNVGTLATIADAFRDGKPSIDRSLTVTGGACLNPRNITVPIGTVIADLVPAEIRVDSDLRRVVFGGPMMGIAVPTLATPVQKNTSGVLLMTAREARHYEEGICIHCARCMKVCSCRLSPTLLNEAILAGDWDRAEKLGLLDCVECGTCSYVCPARIQLVQRFRMGKQVLRTKIQKRKEAERHA